MPAGGVVKTLRSLPFRSATTELTRHAAIRLTRRVRIGSKRSAFRRHSEIPAGNTKRLQGVSPVLVQTWQEPSPGADVAGVSPVSVQMWQG